MPSQPRPTRRPPPERYNEDALKQDNSTGGQDQRSAGSGYAAVRHGAGLIDRPVSGRILLTGADRRSYLQGLLTNDIEALTPGTGCYAAMLTAQGRMMTDMRVLELGDAVMLSLPLHVTAAIRDHLDRFIFSEDVQVEDVTASRAEIGVYGPGAADLLVKIGAEGRVPSRLFETTRVRVVGAETVLIGSDAPGVPGYDIVVDAADAEPVIAALLGAGAVRVSEADAETVRIESGRPRFGVDMDTDTIPLEAGIEDRALSRSKGCYVGQEVIVRVQDRGQGRVAKRLVGLTFEAGAPVPAAAARVMSGEREIGRVTSAAWSPALSRPIALGYAHRDFVEPYTPVAVDGAAGLVAALPFVP
jgi:tRNA-modifying protein YgfZ